MKWTHKINWVKIYNNVFLRTASIIALASWFVALVIYDSWSMPWEISTGLGIMVSSYIFSLFYFIHIRWRILSILMILFIPVLFIPAYSTAKIPCEIENLTENTVFIYIGRMGEPDRKTFALERSEKKVFPMIRLNTRVEILPLTAYDRNGNIFHKEWIILNPEENRKIIEVQISDDNLKTDEDKNPSN